MLGCHLLDGAGHWVQQEQPERVGELLLDVCGGQSGDAAVGEELLRFLNRASDAAYAMARFADAPDPALFAGRARERPKA